MRKEVRKKTEGKSHNFGIFFFLKQSHCAVKHPDSHQCTHANLSNMGFRCFLSLTRIQLVCCKATLPRLPISAIIAVARRISIPCQAREHVAVAGVLVFTSD